MKNTTKIILFILTMVLITSCADVEVVTECTKGHTYGFWSGLWHGFILPFSFVGSLFSDSIAVYAVNNNGGWYDFGFFLGASLIVGGGGRSSR